MGRTHRPGASKEEPVIAHRRDARTSAADPAPPALVGHLRAWLGRWPPARPFDVVGSIRRERPGWDGRVRRVAGADDGQATVLSVPPGVAGAARALDPADACFGPDLAALVGIAGGVLSRGVLRWTSAPADLPELGEWLPVADPRLPDWLRPFGGEALVVFDHGRYVAGLGRKRHDTYCQELAVGTEPAARGRGLARRLVVTAARRVLSEGALPTYLHDPRNQPSARVADAAGFPDRGWQVLGIWAADG